MSFPIPELEFLRSGYFVVKLFSSRHYVYCFRFEMDMFCSLWLGRHSLAPDCSRRSSPNIQSGKYNEMDPILIGTAVSVVTYTDFIALVPTRQTFVGRERAQ